MNTIWKVHEFQDGKVGEVTAINGFLVVVEKVKEKFHIVAIHRGDGFSTSDEAKEMVERFLTAGLGGAL